MADQTSIITKILLIYKISRHKFWTKFVIEKFREENTKKYS